VRLVDGGAAAGLRARAQPGRVLWANLNGTELANYTADTLAEVADQARGGIQRVCASDSLVVGFLAHTGLPLDDEPSP
jgi:hypothetical protein